MRRLIRPTLIWLVLLAAVFATADTLTASIDVSTLVSLIWGIVSVGIYQLLPAKGWPIVLTTYALPLVVCAIAILIVDGTSHWSWQTFGIDIFVTYGSNQALFNGGKAAGVLKP